MQLEVYYPDGTHHRVAPRGPRTTVGRDPACGLVLNHARVSRCHAVIEETPAGLLIRDTESVNGVYLNGRRVDRAALVVGDEIQLGDVRLLVVDETAVEGLSLSEDLPDLDEPPVPPLNAAPAVVENRPLTLSVLATLWLVVLPLALAGEIALGLLPNAAGSRSPASYVGLGLLALVAGALGFGILSRARWAWGAHLAVCALMAPTCLLTPFAFATGLYLLHRGTRAQFGASSATPTEQERPNEAAFATAVLGSLGAAVVVAVAYFSGTHTPPRPACRVSRTPDVAVVERLQAVRAAEESFRQVCNVGYADLDALRGPASVLPGLPPSAAPFVSEDVAKPEAHGYRFDLSVSGPMGPTADCATLRRYRSYRYVATPATGRGRHFLLLSDGTIHWSRDRPAQAEDPLLEPR